MCSTYIQQSMENYQGDLADIIRATGGGGGGGAAGGSTSGQVPAVTDWQFPTDPMNYHPGMIEDPLEDFGHPFSNFRDPLLHELDIPGPSFFGGSGGTADMAMIKSGIEVTGGFGCSGVGGGIVGQKILDEEIKVRPCNIFSRMLQISPNVSPSDSPLMAASPTGLNAPNDMISANSSKSCLMENTGMQISSPRNTGIKRRKSQAKKVVCIPAPAPANSRPTGEIVPSDLWAWRKYGQKPIKGSPYPRGYYRCSSSKGCSARKQVERSRTDPNMLVITYTSEHNHPWPTQRNALAGSTRTQPTKSNNSSNTSKNSTSSQTQKVPRLKEEQHKEISNTTTTNVTNPPVKEEIEDLDKQIDMDDDDDGGDQYSYRPALPDSNHAEDFFADLGEIEADPLSHLFNQGFTAEEERENNKGLDPFSFYDWTVNNNNNNT